MAHKTFALANALPHNCLIEMLNAKWWITWSANGRTLSRYQFNWELVHGDRDASVTKFIINVVSACAIHLAPLQLSDSYFIYEMSKEFEDEFLWMAPLCLIYVWCLYNFIIIIPLHFILNISRVPGNGSPRCWFKTKDFGRGMEKIDFHQCNFVECSINFNRKYAFAFLRLSVRIEEPIPPIRCRPRNSVGVLLSVCFATLRNRNIPFILCIGAVMKGKMFLFVECGRFACTFKSPLSCMNARNTVIQTFHDLVWCTFVLTDFCVESAPSKPPVHDTSLCSLSLSSLSLVSRDVCGYGWFERVTTYSSHSLHFVCAFEWLVNK